MEDAQIAMSAKTLMSFVAVFVLMSSLSAGLDIKHVKRSVFTAPLGIIIGLTCCYGFLPMLSFMLSLIFKLGSSQSIGLILMSTCPGGAFASVATYLFNADLPLSIAMTTASTVLSFIFIIINSTLYLPIIIPNDQELALNYKILFLSVLINLFGIVIGLIISYYKYKYLQKLLGYAGLIIVVISTLYTVYNLSFNLKFLLFGLSFGSLISPLIVLIFSYIFGFGITFFFNLPNAQIVAIALQCGNPNVYLSICLLYVTLQYAPVQQMELALAMPILFTIYGTIVTIIIGIYLKKHKFITIKKHKKLKKLSKSLLKRFGSKKRRNKKSKKSTKYNEHKENDDVLKSISSSSDSNGQYDEDEIEDNPIQEIKEKCQQLFKEIPEAAMQPEKLMEYEYGSDPYDQPQDNIINGESESEDEDGNEHHELGMNKIRGHRIDTDSCDSSD